MRQTLTGWRLRKLKTMRLATFNLESLDTAERTSELLDQRIDILRPQLVRLEADVLCLQEVNAQRVGGQIERSFRALDRLLKGTPYARYAHATSHAAGGGGPADMHNLVVLARYPIPTQRELRHDLIAPLSYRYVTRRPPDGAAVSVTFDRPALIVDLALTPTTTLTVVNAHLRAPRAAAIPGQKTSSTAWASTSEWAEGFFVAGLKRNAQALELRLAIDQILDADPHRMIALAGDLNARDGEVPPKILLAAEDDTGNAELAARSLVPVERSLSKDRRLSVIHHGRPQALDHILVTRALLAHFKSVEIHNEALVDKAAGASDSEDTLGSFHAPMVAEFAFEALD
jgi:endonuclease/exonuclease/phosphatase family metal-dependent hydrolase